jgi:pentatricopeptide repeat protein
MGQAWVGKAGGARRTESGSLGPEEMQALDLFEQAILQRPDHAGAHLAVAELLAPYALASGVPADEGSGTPAASVVTVDRVLEAYAGAVQADPADTDTVNALIAFAGKAGRTEMAVSAFEELTRRDRENPDLLVRFGDYLAGPAGKPEEALGVYGQALIWRPDDAATHLKIADIHLDAAKARLEEHAYVAVEAQLREARKHIGDPRSPQAGRLRETERALAEASGRR